MSRSLLLIVFSLLPGNIPLLALHPCGVRARGVCARLPMQTGLMGDVN